MFGMAHRKWLLVVAGLAVTACTPKEEKPDTAQIGTHERDVRDSIIGQSKLPGAPAVERARDVQATAKERAAALDSIK
jgi:hypothetical protein